MLYALTWIQLLKAKKVDTQASLFLSVCFIMLSLSNLSNLLLSLSLNYTISLVLIRFKQKLYFCAALTGYCIQVPRWPPAADWSEWSSLFLPARLTTASRVTEMGPGAQPCMTGSLAGIWHFRSELLWYWEEVSGKGKREADGGKGQQSPLEFKEGSPSEIMRWWHGGRKRKPFPIRVREIQIMDFLCSKKPFFLQKCYNLLVNYLQKL